MKPRFLCLLLACVLLLASCTALPRSTQEPRAVLTDYKQIEGITADDIRAVEQILQSREKLIWAAVTSPEAFEHDGKIEGSAALIAEHFSELFGIEIELQLGQFKDCYGALMNGTADISADISAMANHEEMYLTTGVAMRTLNIYSLLGQKELTRIEQTRPLRYVFVEHTNAAGSMDSLITPNSELTYVAHSGEAIELILSGEVDALILDESAHIRFENHPEILIEHYAALPFYTTSFATAQEELHPIIDVIQKYLDSEDSVYLSQLYKQGRLQYARNRFSLMLTEEERAYLTEHAGANISVSVLHGTYGETFYNEHSGEIEGLAVGLLNKMGSLTGLTFVTQHASSSAQVYLNLLYEEEESGTYLRASEPFVQYRYALLSLAETPGIEFVHVRNNRVGYRSGSEFEHNYLAWFPGEDNGIAYPTNEELFAALKSGEIDLLLTSEEALYYISHYQENDEIKMNYAINVYDENYFYFAPGEALLCSILDKALTYLDVDEIRAEMSNQIYSYKGEALQQAMLIVVPALILVALLALIFLRFSRINKDLAENDPLTRLPNRRVFERKIAECHAASDGRAISIWFADIDDFKRINDTYGHDFGDEVLIACADALVHALRTGERPFRFGGEEFVGILPGTNEEGALMVANRALENVRAMRFPLYPELRITVSIGVYTEQVSRSEGLNIERLVTCADAAMYTAKRSGKNQVIAYRDGMIGK